MLLSILWAGAQAALLTSAPDILSVERSAAQSRRCDVSLTASIPMAESSNVVSSDATEPILLRAARGEKVERTPVWMMRQAGRHMAAYRELVAKSSQPERLPIIGNPDRLVIVDGDTRTLKRLPSDYRTSSSALRTTIVPPIMIAKDSVNT